MQLVHCPVLKFCDTWAVKIPLGYDYHRRTETITCYHYFRPQNSASGLPVKALAWEFANDSSHLRAFTYQIPISPLTFMEPNWPKKILGTISISLAPPYVHLEKRCSAFCDRHHSQCMKMVIFHRRCWQVKYRDIRGQGCACFEQTCNWNTFKGISPSNSSC